MLEEGGVVYIWCLGYSQTDSRCPCPEDSPGSSSMSPPYGFRYLFSSLLQTECLRLHQCPVRVGTLLMILFLDETLKRPSWWDCESLSVYLLGKALYTWRQRRSPEVYPVSVFLCQILPRFIGIGSLLLSQDSSSIALHAPGSTYLHEGRLPSTSTALNSFCSDPALSPREKLRKFTHSCI